MRKRLLVGVLAATVSAALLGASGASAATEVGSNCTPNEQEEGLTLIPITHTGPLPTAAPVGGVVTGWRTSFPPGLPPDILTSTLKVFRSIGASGFFRVVGESQAGGLVGGTNSFPARISVQAGDRFGVIGNPTTFFCVTGSPADVFGYSPLSSAVGGTQEFEFSTGLQIPVVAIIEPDVDGDGYGDETQDKCPQSAAYQTPCPVVILSALTQPGAKAVTVSVATSLNTSVTVSGTIKLGKGATAKLKAVTAGVAPGTFGKFKLQFPSNLQKRLKELTPKQKLTLKLTASAANITGPASTSNFSAKLKGQG
ncbi:MAG TPA: hypothetical protein VFX45_12300 [Solirubrobacterales bacterium]|nr:hypothetical protein [Solirubrobacterales bacterium]